MFCTPQVVLMMWDLGQMTFVFEPVIQSLHQGTRPLWGAPGLLQVSSDSLLYNFQWAL